MSSSKRHFTAVIGKKEQGSYASSSPSSAARKAVSKLCADDKNRKVEFYMRETTQSSEKKVYGLYIGYMEKLKKPIELKGRVIRYKPVAKLLKNKKMKGGVPSELIIQIPGSNNQDIVSTGDNFVIICDGHGATPGGNGRAIAEDVAGKCAGLISRNMEVNEESLESLKTNFINMVCDNFEDWRVRYPGAGTTALIVVFSSDNSSYMVVKLGDSYVLQIPQGLEQNASAYAFNSIEFEEGKYMPSMSPEKLFKNYTKKGIAALNIRNSFQEDYGAHLTIGRMNKRFKRSGAQFKNMPTLATLSIDPDILLSSDNIRLVFENFTKCGIFQRKSEELLIIASDGLPIQDASIWRIIHSKPDLEQYFIHKPKHDDFTVVIIK
jgi:serine/threonine protein phosphatase PrpC